MRALGAGDRLHRLQRLEHGGDVVVEAPVGVALVRVAPGDREALLARADEVLEHAAPGRDVGDIELVDHRRDEQQRRLAHLRRGRLVLDQLEQLGPHHDGAGRQREVLADREGRVVDHRRDVRRAREVVDEVRGALHEVAAAGVERRLQRLRVERRKVRRRQRIEHVLGREAHAALGALVEAGVADQLVDGPARRDVDLREAAEGRVAAPGLVPEAAVLLRRGDVGLPDDDLRELAGVAHAPARDLPGPRRQAGGELRTRHAREPAAGRPAAGIREQRVERGAALRHQLVLASSGTSISRLRILPVGPFGSSSTNQILRGYL